MAVLVTGGAGYIGSHMALALLDRGETPVVLDNFVTGRRELVPQDAVCIEGDVGDAELLRRIIREHDVREVTHFAGSTVVPESVADPLKYHRNNTANSLVLLEAMAETGVERMVFSSTAAVYAAPGAEPVTETFPAAPASPYGASKLAVERMIGDLSAAGGLRAGILRYFNVAGADPAGRSGQSTPQATHLIKVACEVAAGRRERIVIHGDDWDTPDGTGVRDFIHVSDLVEAHLLTLDHLRAGGETVTLNCGYGRGFSVLDVLRAVERASGRPVPAVRGPRRPGDLGQVVACPDKARAVLGWTPRHDDLDEIVASAYAWETGRRAAA